MKQLKRIVALLMAMAMSLSLLSANVWATEVEPEDGSVSAQRIEEPFIEAETVSQDNPDAENETSEGEESSSEETTTGLDSSEGDTSSRDVSSSAEASAEDTDKHDELNEIPDHNDSTPIPDLVAQSYGSDFSSVTLTGNQANDICSVARAQIGKNGYQLNYYGYLDNAWCAAFVSDCAEKAGIPTSIIPHHTSVEGLYNALLNAGGTVVSTPEAGDIIIYYCHSCGWYKHTAIYGGDSTVIHGNWGNAVATKTIPYDMWDDNNHTAVSGVVERIYVRPSYTNPTPTMSISGTSIPATIDKGSNVNLTGNITANGTITWVWIGVRPKGQFDAVTSCEANPMSSSYDISSIASQLRFNELSTGEYTLSIEGINGGQYFVVYSQDFQVGQKGAPMTSGYAREIPDGDYLIVNAGSSDKNQFYYLDIQGTEQPASNKTNVSLCGPRSGTDDAPIIPSYEIWTLTYDNGFYTIAQKDTSVVLDVAEWDMFEGANVQTYQSLSSNDYAADNQKWAISLNHRNGFRIQSKCSGFSLDVQGGGTVNNTNIQVWRNNDTDAQSWLFIPYQPEQPIENGRYVILSAMGDSIELDVSGNTADTEENANVAIWDSATALSRYNSFDFTKLENGYYRVIHAASGKALDVSNAVSTYGANIQVHSYNGSTAQQWAVTRIGNYYYLRARCSGYALDVEYSETANGTNVSQCPYNGKTIQPNQTWKLVPAEYTVSYNANGGSNVPASQTKYYKEDLILSNSIPKASNNSFKGWNTKVDGTGTTYLPGGSYSLDSDVVLYAQWDKADTPTNADAVFTVGSVSGTPGKQITVPISITKNPGIAGFALDVGYDHSLLTLKNAAAVSSLGGTFTRNNDTVTWFSDSNVSTTGKVFELTFDVSANAGDTQTDVSLSMRDGKSNVTDENSTNVSTDFVKGTVSIRNGVRGDVTGDGDVTIADVVKVNRHVAGKITMTAAEQQAADVTDDGDVTIADVVKLNRYVAGKIITLAVSSALSTQSSSDATITVGSVSATAGQKVSIPVKIGGNPGIAGMALEFSLPSGMTLNSITAGDVLKDGTFTQNGKIITWYATDNTFRDGVILNLNVTAPTSAESYTVKAALKDGKASNFSDEASNSVGVSFEAGKVTVTGNTLSKTKLSSVKWDKKKKNVTVKWKKNTKGKGYEVQYSTDKKFKKSAKVVKIKNNKTVTTTVKKLKKGTWYFRIRTVKGKEYSDWSGVKKVIVK